MVVPGNQQRGLLSKLVWNLPSQLGKSASPFVFIIWPSLIPHTHTLTTVVMDLSLCMRPNCRLPWSRLTPIYLPPQLSATHFTALTDQAPPSILQHNLHNLLLRDARHNQFLILIPSQSRNRTQYFRRQVVKMANTYRGIVALFLWPTHA